VKILIVDNHQLFCDGLKTLLEHEPNTKVIGEANDGRAAVRMAQRLSPDLVIMDVMMPELNGIEATRQIKSILPKVKILALSMHADRHYVGNMLTAGASGYVLKDSAFAELAHAIKVVCQGKRYLSPSIMDMVVDDYVQCLSPGAATQSAPLSELSSREREVLQLIVEGRKTKEIAGRLFISHKTVETHRRNIMGKLGIATLADLIRWGLRQGMASLDKS